MLNTNEYGQHLNEGAFPMMMTETWWETIFSGALSIGVNETKLQELEDESFLYFTTTSLTHEELQIT